MHQPMLAARSVPPLRFEGQAPSGARVGARARERAPRRASCFPPPRPRPNPVATCRSRMSDADLPPLMDRREPGPSAPPLPPGSWPVERVVLLGYMTSGKSTVGQALARRLEWSFLDFDVEIERRDGRTIKQIVQDEGEDRFREMEAALTAELSGRPYLV